MPCTYPLKKRVQLKKFRIKFYPKMLLRTISWEGKLSDSSEQSQRGKGGTRIYSRFSWKKKKKSSQISNDYHYSQKTDIMLMILVLFWVGARSLAYWNYSFGMHRNYLEPISCISPFGIPLRVHHQRQLLWLMDDGRKHILFTKMFGSVLCLLKWQATFFFWLHTILGRKGKLNEQRKDNSKENKE